MIKFNFVIIFVNLLTFLNIINIVWSAEAQTEFETKYGKIRGEVAEGYKGKKLTILRGVPFAKPPIGDLRFKKPQELDKFPSDPLEVSYRPFVFYLYLLIFN